MTEKILMNRSVETATVEERNEVKKLYKLALRYLPDLISHFEAIVNHAGDEEYEVAYAEYEAVTRIAQQIDTASMTTWLKFLEDFSFYQNKRKTNEAIKEATGQSLEKALEINSETQTAIIVYLSIFPVLQAVK